MSLCITCNSATECTKCGSPHFLDSDKKGCITDCLTLDTNSITINYIK